MPPAPTTRHVPIALHTPPVAPAPMPPSAPIVPPLAHALAPPVPIGPTNTLLLTALRVSSGESYQSQRAHNTELH